MAGGQPRPLRSCPPSLSLPMYPGPSRPAAAWSGRGSWKSGSCPCPVPQGCHRGAESHCASSLDRDPGDASCCCGNREGGSSPCRPPPPPRVQCRQRGLVPALCAFSEGPPGRPQPAEERACRRNGGPRAPTLEEGWRGSGRVVPVLRWVPAGIPTGRLGATIRDRSERCDSAARHGGCCAACWSPSSAPGGAGERRGAPGSGAGSHPGGR